MVRFDSRVTALTDTRWVSVRPSVGGGCWLMMSDATAEITVSSSAVVRRETYFTQDYRARETTLSHYMVHAAQVTHSTRLCDDLQDTVDALPPSTQTDVHAAVAGHCSNVSLDLQRRPSGQQLGLVVVSRFSGSVSVFTLFHIPGGPNRTGGPFWIGSNPAKFAPPPAPTRESIIIIIGLPGPCCGWWPFVAYSCC